jgi:hypothetical protein
MGCSAISEEEEEEVVLRFNLFTLGTFQVCFSNSFPLKFQRTDSNTISIRKVKLIPVIGREGP